MRKNLLFTAVTGLLLLTSEAASAQTRTTLDIYVVDVEGGNATLLVTPSGESLLIDTGNTGPQQIWQQFAYDRSVRMVRP